MASARWTAILFGLAGLMGACATPESSAPKDQDGDLTVRPTTVLPESFRKELVKVDRELVLPAGLVKLSQVDRPRAEMRDGPGTHFPLSDRLLEKGAWCFLFEKVGVWQRVLVPATKQKGWVHHQTLSEPKSNSEALRVEAGLLPTVLAMRPIRSVYSYPSKKPVKVAIPKGALFRSLSKDEFGTLVWLAETNSVVWMAGKDVR